MGRVKLAMKFIEDRKARNVTFNKRKAGLKKKAYEFSTLCGVDTCLICYKKDSNEPITWPENRSEVERIIRRYLMVSQEERVKREIRVCLIDEKKKKMGVKLARSHQENTNKPMFPTWDDRLNNWSVSSLRELVTNLDQKIERVRKRIKSLTSSNRCLAQSSQQVGVSNSNFPLHPFPLSCVKPVPEDQHYSSNDFLYTRATLQTSNFQPNPLPHFEKFNDNTNNYSSISTLALINQESSISKLPLFNQESSTSTLPLFNQESSVSTLPLLNQEVGVMPSMNSWELSQSNEFNGQGASFHQQQWFQGNQVFGPSDFLPMNPQSFQKMLPHPQTDHLDRGWSGF